MAMGSTGQGEGLSSDINVTPLIDVLLVLLIIFMITQPLSRKAFDVQVPPEQQQKSKQPPSAQIVLELLPEPPPTRLKLRPQRPWPGALASLFAHAVLMAGLPVEGRAALGSGAVPGGGGGGGRGGGGGGGDRPVINFFPVPARAAPAAVD